MNAYERLVKYVDAASDLAESARKDLKAGKEYSDETVLYLSTFIAAAYAVKDVLDNIEQVNIRLN